MRNCSFLVLGIALSCYASAQPSLHKMSEVFKKQKQESHYLLKLAGENKGAVQFTPASRMMKADVKPWLSSSLGLRTGKDELQKEQSSSLYQNHLEIERYQQWFRGVKVEHGFANVISRSGRVAAMQLEFYPLEESFSTSPKMSEEAALQKAMAYVGAARYAWEDYTGDDPEYKKPVGSLVIVEDYYGKKGKLNLAYKFRIAAELPLSRSYVYVSAMDGSILLVDRIIKHFSPGKHIGAAVETTVVSEEKRKEKSFAPFANASAAAQTRYSGSQTIVTDNAGSDPSKRYRLRQVRNGHDIITLNYQRKVRSTTNDNAAVDFTDDDNNWTTAERSLNYDDAALDVQFAMQYISDYWKNVHGRSSWDNAGGAMKSYVHVRSSASSGYDNAFWSGSAMYYGDGTYYSTDGTGTVANTYGFKPLTALDVSAHELGHAVCQSTAALVYQRESGGLNEGFSDIWAACVENYAGLGKSPFLIGEEIYPASGALRSMQNPKVLGDPDTYGGQYWVRLSLASCPVPGDNNDECGVHYNSGVLNKWFYLVTQGGSGTNDNSDSYNVTGLGFAKAEKIAFLTEQSLTPNADYAATRLAAINAAATLYGPCSNEVVQVTNAWFAVGVGESASCSPVVEMVKTKVTVAEGTGLAGNCSSTQTVLVPVKLGSAATQKTDVQFSFGGTAVQGVQYTVASSVVSFNAGESGTKNLVMTILDNASVEGNKTILLSYSVNANGGNAAAGVNNQSGSIVITEDDALPLPVKSSPVTTVTLLNENFETATPGTIFPAGWDASLAFSGGASTTNLWAIGANGGSGLAGNAAYVSNTAAGTVNYAYDVSSVTDRLLRLPALNTTGLTDLKLRFTYKVGGEVDHINPANTNPNYWSGLWDYGRVVYDASGSGTTSSFTTLFNTAANDYFALYDNGTTALNFSPFRLPASMENKSSVYLGFRWINDNNSGSGIPLAVDDIEVTGRTMGTSIETTAGPSNSVQIVAGNQDTYIASGGGTALLAKLSNVSQTLTCLTASLEQSGSGRTTINTSGGSFFRTQKIVQLTPAVPNATATYSATFYFTTDDLSGWSPAEIQQLKILKVKDDADINGTLTAQDAELVTPTFTDNSASGYYTYTGSFTGFSRFMLVSPTFTLPIGLLSFEAKPVNKYVALSWKTSSEVNNLGFDVERSVDGRTFASVGWVKGAGTTSAETAYLFTDRFVQPGVVYHYRLKQTDRDNRSVYSLIRQAKIAEDGIRMTLSPNPAHNILKIFVAGTAQPATVSLLNDKGQTVAVWKAADLRSGFSVDVGRFSRGLYTVMVHLPGGDRSAKVLLQ